MKLLKNFWLLALVIFLISGAAQAVQVTFLANSASVPDTLNENSTIQMRGDTAPLTWDGASDAVFTNIGGDYWTCTLDFVAGDTVYYKFYSNANDTVFAGAEWEHAGWESDVANGNRMLIVGDADTTLPLQFVNGWQAGWDQFATPWEAGEDTTFVVWVRVNMQGWADFNPATQIIGLRGSNQVDWGQTGELSWGETYPLTQESNHPNGGSQNYSARYFYSGALHVPQMYAGQGLQFKVVVHNAGADLTEDWGNMVYNSSLESVITMPADADTSVHWFWFDNLAPIPVDHQDTVIVNFQADMSSAILNKGFAHGDTLQVRSGYFGTSVEVRTKQMFRQGFTNVYAATDTIVSTIGTPLDYQYYTVKNGIEYREIYYNFNYEGDTAGEAERRIFDEITGDEITVQDNVNSTSENHRMPLFRNVSIVQQDIMVTLTCDVRPAIYQVMAGDTLYDIQSTVDVTDPAEILNLGVAVNGPLSGGWGTWGINLQDEEGRDEIPRRMFDDGTHGDAVAGDSIFTIQYTFYADSGDVVGQEFKFGIGGGDNEGGFGNNHIENIDDSNPTATIAAQFGSIDPNFYYTWDFDNQGPVTGIEDETSVPAVFALQQNYPNPFNPTTNIRYQLPKASDVTLTVYNLLGKEVTTLVNKKQAAGSYQVMWNGTNDAGMPVSSGVYFYRIQAGEFSQIHKMTFLK